MKAKPTHLETVNLRRATIQDAKQVRYRVYQSPTEFIAVIAESALMAIRLAGVPEPYKVVRDLPTSGVALEKGQMEVPETIEHVPLPTKSLGDRQMKINGMVDPEEDIFVEVPLMDIHKKKIPTTSVLDRNAAMRFMGIPDNSPTLSAPPKQPEVIKEPELPPVIVDELPEAVAEKEVLSEDDIAKLLGDT